MKLNISNGVKKFLYNDINEFTTRFLNNSIPQNVDHDFIIRNDVDVKINGKKVSEKDKSHMYNHQRKIHLHNNSICLRVSLLSKLERHLNMQNYSFENNKILLKDIDKISGKFFDKFCIYGEAGSKNYIDAHINDFSKLMSKKMYEFIINEYYPAKNNIKTIVKKGTLKSSQLTT